MMGNNMAQLPAGGCSPSLLITPPWAADALERAKVPCRVAAIINDRCGGAPAPFPLPPGGHHRVRARARPRRSSRRL